jgi:hypothetical protein
LLPPAQKHSGADRAILAQRRAVYDRARGNNPRRWAQARIRNWHPVLQTSLNPVDIRKIERELKKSA